LSAAKAKGRKGKTSKGAAAITSDGDEESEVEAFMEENETTALLARPRPRPMYRSAAPVGDQDPGVGIDEGHDEVVGPAPSDRPRPKATYKSTKSPSKSPNREPQPGVNGTSILDTPRKRDREDDNEEQSATDEGGSPVHGTMSSDIQIRRKRVRH
jgi:cohesin complex subunit SA-1/2